MFDTKVGKPTMKDVAEAVGCHASTVSLALRGDRRISKETRERVILTAKRLGYRVHPLVAAWVKSRRAKKPSAGLLPMAYLDSLKKPYYRGAEDPVFTAAQRESKRYGFSLSKFYIEDYARNIGRLFDVLRTRGISGIVCGPRVEGHAFHSVNWNDFSIVALGKGPLAPAVDRVLGDPSGFFESAFKNSIESGFRRIGLSVGSKFSLVSCDSLVSTYISMQNLYLDSSEHLPVLLDAGSSSKRFEEWRNLARPDIVFSDNPPVSEGSLVDKVTFVDLGEHASKEDAIVSKVVAEAMERIVGLVISNRFGLPPQRRTIFVEIAPEEVLCCLSSSGLYRGLLRSA